MTQWIVEFGFQCFSSMLCSYCPASFYPERHGESNEVKWKQNDCRKLFAARFITTLESRKRKLCTTHLQLFYLEFKNTSSIHIALNVMQSEHEAGAVKRDERGMSVCSG